MAILKIFLFSIFFVLLGVLVWKKNLVNFIAGYKREAVHSPQELSRNIGIILILFGIEILILSLLNLARFTINPEVIGVLAILHVIAVLLCYVYDIIKIQT